MNKMLSTAILTVSILALATQSSYAQEPENANPAYYNTSNQLQYDETSKRLSV